MEIDNQKLKDLEKILGVFDGSRLSKEEFISSFQNVVSLVIKIKNKLDGEVTLMRADFANLAQRLRFDNKTNVDELRAEATGKIADAIVNMMAVCDAKMSDMEDRVNQLEDGEDGEDADEEMILERLIGMLPRENQRETPQSIRNALESLNGDARLDVTAIRGLEELLQKIVKGDSGSRIVGGRTGTLLYVNGVKQGFRTVLNVIVGEDIGKGTSGTTFTLANVPILGTVRVYRGGARQRAGVGKDYTISGKSITLLSALAAGEELIVDYEF